MPQPTQDKSAYKTPEFWQAVDRHLKHVFQKHGWEPLSMPGLQPFSTAGSWIKECGIHRVPIICEEFGLRNHATSIKNLLQDIAIGTSQTGGHGHINVWSSVPVLETIMRNIGAEHAEDYIRKSNQLARIENADRTLNYDETTITVRALSGKPGCAILIQQKNENIPPSISTYNSLPPSQAYHWIAEAKGKEIPLQQLGAYLQTRPHFSSARER